MDDGGGDRAGYRAEPRPATARPNPVSPLSTASQRGHVGAGAQPAAPDRLAAQFRAMVPQWTRICRLPMARCRSTIVSPATINIARSWPRCLGCLRRSRCSWRRWRICGHGAHGIGPHHGDRHPHRHGCDGRRHSRHGARARDEADCLWRVLPAWSRPWRLAACSGRSSRR